MKKRLPPRKALRRPPKSNRKVVAHNLRKPVGELKETLLAIRGGRVDALVVSGSSGDQVLTLQGAEHPYRVLVETINEGAATLDSDGAVLYANNAFANIFGVPLDGLIGRQLQLYLSESQEQKLAAMMAQAAHQSVQDEINVESIIGSRKLIRCSLSPSGTAERPTLSLVATELTELVEANEALRINEDALRQLSARLLQLQDDERRRIARDLHDITGQKLAVLSMVLSRLQQENESTPRAKADAQANSSDRQSALAECLAMAQQVGEEIRTLSYLLHPPLLDELGLASALEWYTQGFESRTGIRVSVDVSKGFMRLPPDAEVTLFRIVQESLTNVHRYSGSSTAYIRLRAEAGTVKLEIGDSGKGIAQTHRGIKKQSSGPVAGLGVGIQGMRERMRQLSGHLQIESRPNQGTIVTAILPIGADVDAAAQPETASPSRIDTVGHPDRNGAAGDVQKSSSRARILIADDHEILRRGVRTMLERESGWEICGEAANGQETVERALALNPDLVILDINMPQLNGLAVVRKILSHRAEMKFLVFTVHESDQTLREIVAAGAHGCLSKTKGGEELIDVVKALLAGKRVYQKSSASAV